MSNGAIWSEMMAEDGPYLDLAEAEISAFRDYYDRNPEHRDPTQFD